MKNASRMARYMMMSAGRDGGSQGNRSGNRGNETRNEYARNDYPRSEMNMGGAEYREGGNIDSRFRDRRGREHYDNGRFAPRSEYGGEGRGRESGNMGGYDRERSKPGSEYRAENRRGTSSAYEPWEDDEDIRGRDGGRMTNIIGFRAPYIQPWGDDGPQSHYGSMSEKDGDRHTGGAESSMRFTPELAKEWVQRMHNEDGTTGEHWTMEQVKKLMANRGVEYDPAQMYAVINAIHSDYSKVLKKHGVSSPDAYLDLAVAWLNDKDAVKNKAAAYYEYVVKH